MTNVPGDPSFNFVWLRLVPQGAGYNETLRPDAYRGIDIHSDAYGQLTFDRGRKVMSRLESLKHRTGLSLVSVAVVPVTLWLTARWLDGMPALSGLWVSGLVFGELLLAVAVWRGLSMVFEEFSGLIRTNEVSVDDLRQEIARLGRQLETPRPDVLAEDLGVLRADLTRDLDEIQTSSEMLRKTGNDLARMTLRITSETTSVAVAAEDANRRVATVVVSGQEFLETISRIGAHAARSAQMGVDAFNKTQATSAAIDELESTSGKIETMTTLISGIANQTNLLALNATIEAARAGEQGRGFAVVAGEVKTLAVETAKAVATISGMVSTIRGATERSVLAIRDIAASIGNLNQASADIAGAVEERIRAAADMAESVTQAASNFAFVTCAIDKIEVAVDETIQGANCLRSAANEIAERTAFIHRDVERYIESKAVSS